MAHVLSGRFYHLGNDYPSDVGKRDAALAENTWAKGSYLDGIYTSAAAGFISGSWNVYYKSDLPQDGWTSIADDPYAVFPANYATTTLVAERDHVVSAYAETSGYEGIVEKNVINEYNVMPSKETT